MGARLPVEAQQRPSQMTRLQLDCRGELPGLTGIHSSLDFVWGLRHHVVPIARRLRQATQMMSYHSAGQRRSHVSRLGWRQRLTM